MIALLTNRFFLGAIGSALVLWLALSWYNGRIDAAIAKGYAQRSTEIDAAHAEVVQEKETENDRLRTGDQVRVETVEVVKVVTETVIEYIEREIPVVDTSQCFALSADWVRLYNAAWRADCGNAEAGTDCAFVEDPLSGLQDFAPWSRGSESGIGERGSQRTDWSRLPAEAGGSY